MTRFNSLLALLAAFNVASTYASRCIPPVVPTIAYCDTLMPNPFQAQTCCVAGAAGSRLVPIQTITINDLPIEANRCNDTCERTENCVGYSLSPAAHECILYRGTLEIDAAGTGATVYFFEKYCLGGQQK
ncbi:hypothetical protein B0J13DRAFT_612985 [Dactylonectria estremocensis]|uniref:Apple domain-containing protein n=1 Tax=Dactylonectria estremocensis TaxID=1079267 RepID=A0A9P9DGH4_9HYPO|nr:hypothetical protein B0J13DRAFT_612985 [Dactylonectria estremocensis]